MTKDCTGCKQKKDISDFYRNANGKPYSRCKCCHCSTTRRWQDLNWKKVLAYAKTARQNAIRKNGNAFYKMKSDSNKRWRSKNKEKISSRRKVALASRPDIAGSSLDRIKRWGKENRVRALAASRKNHARRYRGNPDFKAKVLLRNRVNKAIARFGCKGFKKILGCTQAEFREHIQRQFKPGMNWNNHGVRGWHYDHIFPLAKCKNEEELIRACQYKNIQPLWWHENNLKRDKIPEGVSL